VIDRKEILVDISYNHPHEFISWNAQYATVILNNPVFTPSFVSYKSLFLIDEPGIVRIPFEKTIVLPEPRKGRVIVERDVLGRIVHSKVPQMSRQLKL